MKKAIAAALGLVLICGTVWAQNSRYEFVPGQICWSDANAAAQAAGGHLATIASQEENDIIEDLIDENAWIGFTDQASEGNFVWVTGEPVVYTNWEPGEPNDSGGEDFTEFQTFGQWNDLSNCDDIGGYVVEFEGAIPTLGTWGLVLLASLLVIAGLRFRRKAA